jgi:hypothetical protein
MRKIRIFAVLAGAMLALGLVAGCGSDDKEEYADEVQGVLEPLGEDLQALGTEVSSVESPEAFAEAISNVQDTLNQGVSDLESIDPPEDVTDVHADLIAAFESFNTSLDGVREAAEDGNVRQLQSAAAELPTAALEFQQQLNDVTERAKEAGVPVDESADTSGTEESGE